MSARYVVVPTQVHLAGVPPTTLRVIYAVDPETGREPFEPLIHYMLEQDGARRLAWQRNVATTVCMLLEFMSARGGAERVDSGSLRAFAEALLSGTHHLETPELQQLGWPPRARRSASAHLHAVTVFLDWLSERTGMPNPNPWRMATAPERLTRLRHLEKRNASALLGHAACRHRAEVAAGRVRTIGVRARNDDGTPDEALAFDEAAFLRLLAEGFSRPAPPLAPLARRLQLRDILIAILLHAGGLRISEPFHLFLGDITEDSLRPGSALVRLFHPAEGRAPVEDGHRWRNREHYLRGRWQRVPRTLEHGRFHAGWKNLALSGRERCAVVQWFPEPWGEAFLHLFRCYLTHRPRGDHPFLFVSEHPAHRGEPYTLESFCQAHARAVRRIGLVPSKGGGTSPHAHRHAYGTRLRQAGLDPLFIQKAMHHRSPHSQLVYTAPSQKELGTALREANAQMLRKSLADLFGGGS